MNKAPFIKWQRTKEVVELMKKPDCFMLLAQIAYRARRTDEFNANNLEIGEALIGDFLEIGLTHRKYRTATEKLKKWGFATFKPTNKGTIAKLVDTRVFDINCEAIDKPIDKTATNKRQTRDKQETTNKNDKNDKNVINIPDYIKADLWNEFLTIRLKLKAVNSNLAITGILNKLERWRAKGYDPNEIIQNSIEGSWKTVYGPKAAKQTKTSGTNELINDFINEK